MGHTAKILRYEFQNVGRSRWLLGIVVVLFLLTEVLFRFGGDPGKTLTSLMNVVLLLIPLMSLTLGAVYSYSSREFNEILLAQPISRTSVYLGKLTGFSGTLCLAFLAGVGLPFLIHSFGLRAYAGKLITMLAVGACLVFIFSALAFYVTTRFEDRIKGLGTILVTWFVLAVVWDGLILLFINLASEYPYEPGLIGLVFLNPVDLGRVMILLQMDISALMGYTGAVFRNTFGSQSGTLLAAGAMLVYAAVPVAFGLRSFRRKDF